MRFRKLLLPFNLLYSFAIYVRNKAYDMGWRKSFDFEVPIIGLGNLQTGGTGKSPHTAYIVKILQEAGHVPAILSRGYGRKTHGFKMVEHNSSANQVGDEPLMLYKKTNTPTAVCEDRVLGIPLLLAESDAEGIVLDDCFQHRRVKPGLMFLLCPYDQPYHDDTLLPSGNLREPSSGAKRAHALILTKAPTILSDAEREKVKKQFPEFKPEDIYISSIRYSPINRYKTKILPNVQVALLTGLANPIHLENYIQSEFQLVKHFQFSDHHAFSKKELEAISNFCGKKIPLITSEKDFVKLPEWFKELVDLYVQAMEPVFSMSDETKLKQRIISYWENALLTE